MEKEQHKQALLRNIEINKEIIEEAKDTIHKSELAIKYNEKELAEFNEPIQVIMDSNDIYFVIPQNGERCGNQSMVIKEVNYNRAYCLPGYQTFTSTRASWIKFFKDCLEELERK